MPGRIFISYSKAEPEPTQELAASLAAQGYSVWWDTNLTSGEVFREVIDRELDAADAVIVIWTSHSVASNWVIAEADHAARRNRLITVRAQDLEPWRIPKPYNTYQADLVDNRNAVLAAVRRVAGEPPKPEVKSSPNLSEAALNEALALEHWRAIKTSADPTKFRSFLADFGDTKCAPLARAEFERLAKSELQKHTDPRDFRAQKAILHRIPGWSWVFIVIAIFFFGMLYLMPAARLALSGMFGAEPVPDISAPAQSISAMPGLRSVDTRVGTGPLCGKGSTCTVSYTGWLYENGSKGKKFDSSIDRGVPFHFTMGAHQVIEGWEAGVTGMRVGGKRTLIVPPSLGYGSQGAGSAIPPNSVLLFEIELLAVQG